MHTRTGARPSPRVSHSRHEARRAADDGLMASLPHGGGVNDPGGGMPGVGMPGGGMPGGGDGSVMGGSAAEMAEVHMQQAHMQQAHMQQAHRRPPVETALRRRYTEAAFSASAVSQPTLPRDSAVKRHQASLHRA